MMYAAFGSRVRAIVSFRTFSAGPIGTLKYIKCTRSTDQNGLQLSNGLLFLIFLILFNFWILCIEKKGKSTEIEREREGRIVKKKRQCDRWLDIYYYIHILFCVLGKTSNAWRTQWILASLMGGDDDLVGDIMSASIVQKGPTHLLCFGFSIHLLFIQMQFFFFIFFFLFVSCWCLLPFAWFLFSVTSIVRRINARFVHWHPEKILFDHRLDVTL